MHFVCDLSLILIAMCTVRRIRLTMENYFVLLLILLAVPWSFQDTPKLKPTKAAIIDLKNKTEVVPSSSMPIANVTALHEKLAEVHIDQQKTIRISKGDLDDLLDVYMGKIAESAATIKDRENEINKLQTKEHTDDDLLKRFENLTEICNAQNATYTAKLKEKADQIKELEQKVKVYETRLKRKQHVLTDLRKQNTSSAALIDHLRAKVVYFEGKFREKKDDLLADWEAATTTCMPYGMSSGIHLIHLPGFLPFLVSCEGLTTAGPGWMAIQRRLDGSVSFYRNWDQYRKGFGKLNGEFFIGLEKLHRLTSSQPHELYISFRRFNGESSYAHYDDFVIGSEEEGYELKLLGHYQGNSSDALRTHDKMKFSTFDRDNDEFTHMNCAEYHHGAWWYDFCSRSNLNGKYFKAEVDNVQGIFWEQWYSFRSLRSVQMLIRPKSQMELNDLPRTKRTVPLKIH
ncbi:fibrinogen-like protein 1 isoform X1 [Drosophila miranda]|uniref:fibrinogen-like protein 1 isoform X1 n=1 Tax=Drosophila miranda TaxID=7229 RepID=UPI00143FA53A|nr:fibrinogen-like protein 1 isoform X1 [Drosophila miranda]